MRELNSILAKVEVLKYAEDDTEPVELDEETLKERARQKKFQEELTLAQSSTQNVRNFYCYPPRSLSLKRSRYGESEYTLPRISKESNVDFFAARALSRKALSSPFRTVLSGNKFSLSLYILLARSNYTWTQRVTASPDEDRARIASDKSARNGCLLSDEGPSQLGKMKQEADLRSKK